MDAIFTTSNEETKEFAGSFAKKLKAGDILCLYGNLGAGKTTFVQGLVKGLGVTKRIISPTFVIVRSYKLNLKSQISNLKSQNAAINMFYHVDLYRLQSEKDMASTGLSDIMQDKNAIIAIEWPEKMGLLIPKKRWEIKFENMGEDKRKISFENYGQ